MSEPSFIQVAPVLRSEDSVRPSLAWVCDGAQLEAQAPESVRRVPL